MSPREWRAGKHLSLETLARLLGVEGRNPGRTFQRWEDGLLQPPLRVIAKLEVLSDGAVTTQSWIAVKATRQRSTAEMTAGGAS